VRPGGGDHVRKDRVVYLEQCFGRLETVMQTQPRVDARVGRCVDRPGSRWYRSGPLPTGVARSRVELLSAPSIHSRKFSP
jgi:hypothetical protein